jgi:signal peptidase I
MQCPSCRFENMPGVDACGRCGSPLRLATAVIDVHPPRAKPWRKRLRRILPVRRTLSEAKEAFRDANERTSAFFETRDLPIPPGELLVRMPFVSWPYFYQGEKALAWTVLVLYLGLMLSGFALAGTFLGSILLGLGFSVHASSTLSILFRYGGSTFGRLRAAFFVLAVLGLLIYLPVFWAITRVAVPITVNEGSAPIEPGDVYLVNRSAYAFSPPGPGDVVLYHSANAIDYPMPGGGHGMIRIPAGVRIDRVLAGPGSDVRWENGQLFVNGVESPFRPLNPAVVRWTIAVHVPQDHYFIVPTTLPHAVDARVPGEFWTTGTLVAAGNIEGKVFLRTQPFLRFGTFH